VFGKHCAAVRQGSWYAVIDPHARLSDGTVYGRGKSVVVFHPSIDALVIHFRRLGASMKAYNHPFEVTGVQANMVDKRSQHDQLVRQDNTDAERVSKGVGSEMASCSQSLTDFISTDQMLVNEPCTHENTGKAFDCSSNENASEVELVLQNDCVSLTDIISTDQAVDETYAQKKTMSLCPRSESTADVEFISQTDSVSYQFSPLTLQQQKSICLKLNIVHVVKDQNNADEIVQMAEPCKTKDIVGDGNCFFRSVAYAVSSSEQEHRKLRRAVVTHILQNEGRYSQYLRQGHSSVVNYIDSSRMKYVGTWATELEIQATSDLIGVDIFTYSQDKWLKYSSSNVSVNRQSSQSKGIYLKHVNTCHYEVVVCVKRKDHSCVSNCKSSFEASMCHASLNANSDPRKLYRQKVLYNSNQDFKEEKRINVNKRYHDDETYKRKLLTSSTEKYKQNEQFQQKVKKISTDKYKSNFLHQQAVKEYSIQKYATNTAHKEAVKNYSVDKYSNNSAHKEAVKKFSVDKYNENEIHKSKVIDYNKEKYKNDISFVNSIKMRNAVKRCEAEIKRKEFDCVIKQFKEKISTGPDYVCSVCHRCCFKMQVKNCNKNKYFQISVHAGYIAEKCITLNYLHKCNRKCNKDCVYKNTPAESLWICHTCDRKISEGKMPAESVANNLALDPIPDELSCLNSLEEHLIAKHIPFMKMLALPKGGQNGIHGPVTCVPSNVTDVVNVLPRSENDDLMIRIKLKRKLTYKGHYEYKFAHTDHVKTAAVKPKPLRECICICVSVYVRLHLCL